MSTKKTDMEQVLNLQGEAFDPDKKFDLNRVKLCIQFSVTNPKEGFEPCTTLYSSTIYNKHNSAFKNLEIKKMYSDNRSPMDGGKEIMITGNIPPNATNTNTSSPNASDSDSDESNVLQHNISQSNFLQVCFQWTGPGNYKKIH